MGGAEHFWSSPRWGTAARHGGVVALDSSQAKVADLDSVAFIDEKIGRLQVAMDDRRRRAHVKVPYAIGCVAYHTQTKGPRELDACVVEDVLEAATLHVLGNDRQMGLTKAGSDESEYIVMVEIGKDRNLVAEIEHVFL